jgi:hypothetical protein
VRRVFVAQEVPEREQERPVALEVEGAQQREGFEHSRHALATEGRHQAGDEVGRPAPEAELAGLSMVVCEVRVGPAQSGVAEPQQCGARPARLFEAIERIRHERRESAQQRVEVALHAKVAPGVERRARGGRFRGLRLRAAVGTRVGCGGPGSGAPLPVERLERRCAAAGAEVGKGVDHDAQQVGERCAVPAPDACEPVPGPQQGAPLRAVGPGELVEGPAVELVGGAPVRGVTAGPRRQLGAGLAQPDDHGPESVRTTQD